MHCVVELRQPWHLARCHTSVSIHFFFVQSESDDFPERFSAPLIRNYLLCGHGSNFSAHIFSNRVEIKVQQLNRIKPATKYFHCEMDHLHESENPRKMHKIICCLFRSHCRAFSDVIAPPCESVPLRRVVTKLYTRALPWN